jgi:hypothetical protein
MVWRVVIGRPVVPRTVVARTAFTRHPGPKRALQRKETWPVIHLRQTLECGLQIAGGRF